MIEQASFFILLALIIYRIRMAIIKLGDKEFGPYISSEEIQSRVQDLALRLEAEYKDRCPLILGVLNGSFMFAADLLKACNFELEISFIKLASYEGTSSSGKVNELIGLKEDINGRDILVLEDIVDTGNTIEKIDAILKDSGAASVAYVSLLYKPEAYKKDIPIEYRAFEIPNEFVVGYGLDYDGLGRNIDSIYKIKA